jgi:hypothetical protein
VVSTALRKRAKESACVQCLISKSPGILHNSSLLDDVHHQLDISQSLCSFGTGFRTKKYTVFPAAILRNKGLPARRNSGGSHWARDLGVLKPWVFRIQVHYGNSFSVKNSMSTKGKLTWRLSAVSRRRHQRTRHQALPVDQFTRRWEHQTRDSIQRLGSFM